MEIMRIAFNSDKAENAHYREFCDNVKGMIAEEGNEEIKIVSETPTSFVCEIPVEWLMLAEP